jgi:hypothetical protein
MEYISCFDELPLTYEVLHCDCDCWCCTSDSTHLGFFQGGAKWLFGVLGREAKLYIKTDTRNLKWGKHGVIPSPPKIIKPAFLMLAFEIKASVYACIETLVAAGGRE